MKKRRNSKGKKPAEKDELTMFGDTVKNCMEGASPNIQFTRKGYREGKNEK